MSAHHDDHHSNEQKPVSFTVPFYLALATLVILISFLSLCNPKKGHHGACECKEECTEACMKKCEEGGHDGKECKGHEEEGAKAAEAEATPVVAADSTAKPAEAAPAAEEKH